MTLSSGQSEPCPVCAARRYDSFFEMRGVPTQDGMLWRTREEALYALKGDIRLAFCHVCGYIGNQLFDPAKILYDDDYTFSMFFSPTFRTFLTSVAERLIDRHGLRGKSLLEIACGEGDFIKLLCQLGGNRGLGVDPTTKARVEGEGALSVRFVQERYTEAYAGHDVDFICCRQALDQLPQPRVMVDLVRRNIGDRLTPVYFEVPNAESIFEDLLIRNIMYEKSSWFTARSLARMFALCGFTVTALEPCFDGGQYLGLEAVPGRYAQPGPDPGTAPTPAFVRAIETFGARHDAKLAAWRTKLGGLAAQGRRVMAWGSGAGAVNFLSSLDVRDQVPYVVDINPRRQGRFMPLTGQEVVPPSFVPGFSPEVVIITNATFEREIAQQLADLGVVCDIWTI